MLKHPFKSIFHKGRNVFGIPEPASRSEYFLIFFMLAIYAAILSALLFSLIERMWLGVFVSVISFGVIWGTRFIARRNRFSMPVSIEFFLTLFLYASLILGEVHGYYTRFWWWDTVLHAGSGIALGFIGFLILYALYRKGKLEASAFLIAFFAFCFALALGALWEVFEFGVDQIFGVNMQKSGLVDTMWDLMVDTVGALITSIAGYFYIKHDVRGTGLMRYYLRSVFRE